MWEQIKKNRRKTVMYWFLTTLFIIFLLILMTFLAGPGLERKGISTEFVYYFFIIAWVLLSIGACLYGDRLLLKVSKANKVNRFVHPQLFNVVEEIKIASDLSIMPDIYIMPSYSINAFATGVRLDHSTIVVTAGLLSKLDRDELQAVIAHEISHIINRDVVLLTFIGTLWGSFLLTLLFFGLLLGGGDKTPGSYRRDEQNFEVKINFSNIFYSTLSKTREYLADASAVRLTRNPMALASALEKIYIEHNRVDVANSITAPMYIEAPLKTKKTHPPIRDRIKILKEMSYCVNYSEYQRAYNSVLETHKNIIPPSALTMDKAETIKIEDKNPNTEIEKKATQNNNNGLNMRETIFENMSDEDINKQDIDSEDTNKNENELSNTRAVLFEEFNQEDDKNKMYKSFDCQCGIRITFPPGFKEESYCCPRCGRIYNSKSTGFNTRHFNAVNYIKGTNDLTEREVNFLEVDEKGEEYYLLKNNEWESLLCSCGTVLQLAPDFSMKYFVCKGCSKRIRVRKSTDNKSEFKKTQKKIKSLSEQENKAQWEKVFCECGTFTWRSPNFNGKYIKCRTCSRKINIDDIK